MRLEVDVRMGGTDEPNGIHGDINVEINDRLVARLPSGKTVVIECNPVDDSVCVMICRHDSEVVFSEFGKYREGVVEWFEDTPGKLISYPPRR